MKSILKLHNKRMLAVMKYCIDNNLKGCADEYSWVKSIGMSSANNLGQIKEGFRGFTVQHLMNCKKVYGVDGNFLLDEKHTKMFVEGKIKPVILELKEIVSRVAIELNGH